MQLALRILAVAAAGTLLLAPSQEVRRRPLVAVQPFAGVDARVLEAAVRAIGESFECEVVILPARELPPDAFYEPRRRYRGDVLLKTLAVGVGFDKVIGLTGSDVSVTKPPHEDWGVFGVGQLGGRACVVSSFRLGSGEVLLRRVRVVVLHELGHTFGLPHCETVGCIMEDAKGKVATVDRSSGEYCESCSPRLPLRSAK